MSIQTKEYTSKKTNKTTTNYYAVVFNTKTNKTVWSGGFKSRSEAKREEARLVNDLAKNKLITKSGVKLDEVKDLWLVSYKDVYSNSTYEGYVWYYKRYIQPVFGKKSVSEIKPIHIQKFVNAMSQKYSAETVNKCINILSNIFNYAINPLKLINENPVDGIKRKKIVLKKGVTWSSEQIANFLLFDKVIKSSYYELILTSFLLGVRPSEVCGLFEIDLKSNGVLSFSRGYDRYGVISDMKTENSHRPIQLSKEHYRILLNRIDKQKMQAIKKGDKYNHSGFLFKQYNGNPYNPNNYSKAFKRLLREYNNQIEGEDLTLPDICLYGARHSFATNLIVENNVNASIVSSIMGNSVRVLTRRYVHTPDEAQGIAVSDYQKDIFGLRKEVEVS